MADTFVCGHTVKSLRQPKFEAYRIDLGTVIALFAVIIKTGFDRKIFRKHHGAALEVIEGQLAPKLLAARLTDCFISFRRRCRARSRAEHSRFCTASAITSASTPPSFAAFVSNPAIGPTAPLRRRLANLFAVLPPILMLA